MSIEPSPALGILGGTFDPPHMGHLILAQSALDILNLSHVLFVPAADPPHKHHLPITPVMHRVSMLELAIEDNPRFMISRVDMDRPGPHYTVDTLDILCKKFPGIDLYFLMGGDSLHDFASWRDPEGIIERATLAVMRRPGSVIDISDLEAKLPGIQNRIAFVDAPIIGISATLIRDRLRVGHSIRYQVPDKIERYILTNRLYRD